MKKFVLSFLILLAFAENLNSQNWCTPSSEWYYTRATLYGPGYAKVNYAGTVTVNSQVCQQLNYYSQVYNYPNSTVNTNSYVPYHYTYEANNVIYLFNQYTNNFDTLYNYGATIGSKWLLPANYPVASFPNPCNKYTLTVLDTGHSFIQSVNLKWFKVTMTNSASQFQISDTLYQRLGLLNTYFLNFDICTGNSDYTEGGPLRCFNDNQISNYKRTTQPCTFLISEINENRSSLNLWLFPNPVSDNLTFINWDLDDQKGDLFFCNTLGQVIKKVEYQNKEKITVEDLDKGIYFIKFVSESNKIYTGKIIKN